MFSIFKENEFLQKLNNNKYFEEGICYLMLLVSFVTWLTSYSIGLYFILAIAIILLVLFNDFKYMLPVGFSVIFSLNQGFNMDTVPINTIIGGVGFLLLLVLYVIKNRLNVKKLKSWPLIAVMAILGILPMLWNNNVGDKQFAIYFLYFAWVLYLILYVIYSGSLKQNSFRMLCYTMTYVGLLMVLQCMVMVLKNVELDKPALIWFDLGWGIGNEAGIMLCVSLPFLFVRLVKANRIPSVIYNCVLIGFFVLGMILTNSRGTYLFGGIMFVCLILISLLYGKKKGSILICYLSVILAAYITIQSTIGLEDCVRAIITEVFSLDSDADGVVSFAEIISVGFSDSGRGELWEEALSIFNENTTYKFLGCGMVTNLDQFRGRITVYHSTLFETLACFGLVGTIVLALHIIQKYFSLMRFERGVLVVMAFGYALVDMYGMLDNTYHMYYYMIALMLIMACVDNERYYQNDNMEITINL